MGTKQRRRNSFSTLSAYDSKKQKCSPNSSFTIYNGSQNTTTTDLNTTTSATTHQVIFSRKPIWNCSTRLSYTMPINVEAGNRSLHNLNAGQKLSKSKSTPRLDKKSSEKKNIPKSDIVKNGSPHKTETTNVRKISPSVPCIKIYSIWSEKLDKDQITAEAAWSRCRTITMEALEKFNDRLTILETIVSTALTGDSLLDMSLIEEKKKEVEGVLFELEDYDIEMKEVTKAIQNVAQYLPPVDERENLKNQIFEVRQKYFKVVQELVRLREVFRWLIPLLDQYKQHGSDIKSWLDITEARSETFTNDFNNNDLILQYEGLIESIREELFAQKEVYEDFLDASESIMDLFVDNENITELKEDHDSVVERWDALCSSIEKCFNRLEVARKIASEKKCKTDPERIEKKIRSEAKKCTCHVPFQIIKVGDGKYTFGTSKVVRLLRVHGNSIVVRVGGGWEYLYDFLFKVDPCRAKQAMKSNSSEMKSLDLSGLEIMPTDKKGSEFSLNVQRMTPKSWAPYNRNNRYERSNSLGSAASSTDNMDGDESSDSYTLSTSTGASTPGSRSSSKTSFTPTGKRVSQNSKLGSLDSMNSRSGSRLSLVERQAVYAEKKKMAQKYDNN